MQLPNTCYWSRLPGWGWSHWHPPTSSCLSPPRQMWLPQAMAPETTSFSDFALNIGCLYFFFSSLQWFSSFHCKGLQWLKIWIRQQLTYCGPAGRPLQKIPPPDLPDSACSRPQPYLLLSYWRNTWHCRLIGWITLQPAFCTCSIWICCQVLQPTCFWKYWCTVALIDDYILKLSIEFIWVIR